MAHATVAKSEQSGVFGAPPTFDGDVLLCPAMGRTTLTRLWRTWAQTVDGHLLSPDRQHSLEHQNNTHMTSTTEDSP
jgi:hypothetical protein